MRTQTDNNSSPFKEQRLCGSLAPDALSKMLKTMEELDAPENIPEGLNPLIWERFCLVRRTKVESEQKVKRGLERVKDGKYRYLQRPFTLQHFTVCLLT